MEEYILLADAAANPVITAAQDGRILHMNASALRLTEITGLANCKELSDLSPALMSPLPEDGLRLEVSVSGLNYAVTLLNFDHGSKQKLRLCIFDDNVMCSKLVAQLLEAIDEGICVIDMNGLLEAANRTALYYIGIDPDERSAMIRSSFGKNLQEVLRDEQLLRDALNPIVIKEKKTVRRNLEYNNGKVVTYTGTPVFDEAQQLRHVVLTGRDVSRLVSLESQLDELEKIKNNYYSQLMAFEKSRDAHAPISSSKKMEYVLGLASKVGATDAPIFLTGESGVGKEEVARFIHRSSDRKDGPFIAINCAAIPEQLVESELFGFAANAFTGAGKTGKRGLLEEANGGTFFLDEIGELPFNVQSKLLRVVQEQKMYRIGSTAPIELDVRYVSATNLSEQALANSAKFRRDLYYRLCVVPISIPPLRERKDDIIPLISHFLEGFNKKYKKNIRINNQALRKMTKLDWPGNVRELKNVVERLVILSSEGPVDEAQLKTALDMGSSGTKELITVTGLMPLAEAHDLIDSLLINEAYTQYGSIVETAKVLKIDPSTIHRKIKEGKLTLESGKA